jgi:predicted RNase H-like HicB family nuclease
MHKYEIIIFWSDEDHAFVAEAPELPGCAAHGDSPEAALANCQKAIDLWLALPGSSAVRSPNRRDGAFVSPSPTSL